MEFRLSRPAVRCCRAPISTSLTNNGSSWLPAASLQFDGRRQKSSTARMKRSLNIPPHPTFLAPNESSQDHIIFNPPSSAPSVYHTPFKFLPKSDPRRRANLTSLFESSETIDYSSPASPSASATASLPPPVRSEKHSASAKRHHLTQQDVAELRRLRAEDPATWTVPALSQKFECSPMFVMICCHASREHKDAVRERLDRIKTRWGPIRTQARADRARRKEMLMRQEI